MSDRVIDTKSRLELSTLLRKFVSGKITNFELEDSFISSDDPVIDAIQSSIWCFYYDFDESKLGKENPLSKDAKKAIARWIMFLRTTIDYSWPDISFAGVRTIDYGFWGKITGKAKKQENFIKTGEYAVWPFIDNDSYISTKNNPTLLADSKFDTST